MANIFQFREKARARYNPPQRQREPKGLETLMQILLSGLQGWQAIEGIKTQQQAREMAAPGPPLDTGVLDRIQKERGEYQKGLFDVIGSGAFDYDPTTAATQNKRAAAEATGLKLHPQFSRMATPSLVSDLQTGRLRQRPPDVPIGIQTREWDKAHGQLPTWQDDLAAQKELIELRNQPPQYSPVQMLNWGYTPVEEGGAAERFQGVPQGQSATDFFWDKPKEGWFQGGEPKAAPVPTVGMAGQQWQLPPELAGGGAPPNEIDDSTVKGIVQLAINEGMTMPEAASKFQEVKGLLGSGGGGDPAMFQEAVLRIVMEEDPGYQPDEADLMVLVSKYAAGGPNAVKQFIRTMRAGG